MDIRQAVAWTLLAIVLIFVVGTIRAYYQQKSSGSVVNSRKIAVDWLSAVISVILIAGVIFGLLTEIRWLFYGSAGASVIFWLIWRFRKPQKQ